MRHLLATAWRGLALLLVSALALELYFCSRVGLMAIVDPQSTSFQRSEVWRLLSDRRPFGWRQQWVGYERIAPALKRAVIASEDAGFAEHSGVEWDALEKAWGRNQRAEARVAKINAEPVHRLDRPLDSRLDKLGSGEAVAARRLAPPVQARIVGGSTITQQLAKNLFLDGERSLARKAQEFAITFMLETCLSKRRIFEIYLNSVEWGEGVFGAEAAAKRYFRVDAAALTASQAAQLAVMLPAPKRFEKRPGFAYVVGRAATVAARMGGVELP